MSENHSPYFDTMPGAGVVGEQLQLEYGVARKALDAAIARNEDLHRAQTVDLVKLHNRRPPQGILARRELPDNIVCRDEELGELTARVNHLRCYVAWLLEAIYRQANERVAAAIMAHGRTSDGDEGPQQAQGAFLVRER